MEKDRSSAQDKRETLVEFDPYPDYPTIFPHCDAHRSRTESIGLRRKKMSRSQTHRAAFAAFSVCVLLAFILLGFNVAAKNSANEARRVASIIRIAPAAPVFDEKERLSELSQRRARVAKTIGPTSLLILFSTEPRVYANDVDYQYRQENNLYYLTNLKQNGATLVLLPGNKQAPEILFIPRRNAFAETWTGHMYSPEEASQ